MKTHDECRAILGTLQILPETNALDFASNKNVSESEMKQQVSSNVTLKQLTPATLKSQHAKNLNF
jgi:hypothetical protein